MVIVHRGWGSAFVVLALLGGRCLVCWPLVRSSSEGGSWSWCQIDNGGQRTDIVLTACHTTSKYWIQPVTVSMGPSKDPAR